MAKVKPTSIAAFDLLKANGTIQAQQNEILVVMKPGIHYTRRQLSTLTGIETSTVSARVNSMLDVYIQVDGKKKDPTTGKTVEAIILLEAAND